MITKYAVYNATSGENILYDSRDEAIQAFWANVVNFAKSQFHDTAYTVVEQHEDGTETWYNDQNQEIDKPKTISEIEEIISNPTPVETLP